jgi:hypothetical protein
MGNIDDELYCCSQATCLSGRSKTFHRAPLGPAATTGFSRCGLLILEQEAKDVRPCLFFFSDVT